MKTLSIVEMRATFDDLGKYVMFSDGNRYGVDLVDLGHGWDCFLHLLPSHKNVTSQLRRKMVLQHLGLDPAVTRQEKSRINNLHRNLPKYGYKLRKSHASKYPNPTNRGGYKVTDGEGQVVLGPCFSATLDQVEAFLVAKIAEFKAESHEG